MTRERSQRGWFIGGLAFAFGGVLCLAVSIFGWVSVGFMVQDNTQVHQDAVAREVGAKGNVDAWADTAESMNDHADWDNYAAPGEGS